MMQDHGATSGQAAGAPCAGTLRIEGEMTIYRAAELAAQLLASLGSDGCLRLDLAEVSEVDSAGLQLLVATQHAAMARGGHVQLVAASPAVGDMLALLELAPHFGPTALPMTQDTPA